MKLSYNWIKEYVDVGVSPEELARGLTMSGSEVSEIEENRGDHIMELEITTNRPDCLNMVGLAREACAVFDKDLKAPDMNIAEDKVKYAGPAVKCEINDKALCPRYTARVITNVKVAPSDAGMAGRLESLGLRTVNNIVDITNFCLMETGQPMHAFDLDKIEGGKIFIRKAKKGEKIVTIDEVERKLEAGMLIIADSKKPVAIAGVMGSKETEVDSGTKNILLESAYFDPVSVRRTARALGLSSDSSYRFERGVDKDLIDKASDRATSLITAIAGGEICDFYDVGALSADDIGIEFDVQNAGAVLGISLSKEEAAHILKRLGMGVANMEHAKLLVTVPGFREDLRVEVDLIEEVARIYGYDKIPAVINRFIPQVKRKEHSRQVREKICSVLPALGLNEIMTYSLISDAAVDRFKPVPEDTVQLVNPLSEEHKKLTPQLLDGMFKAISWNLNRKNMDLKLFEIGKNYAHSRKTKKFVETPVLCIGLTGNLRKNWQEGERGSGFYDIKWIIEEMMKDLNIEVSFEKTIVEGFKYGAAVKIGKEGSNIGFIGESGKKLADEYDITETVYICHIDLDQIYAKAVLLNKYKPIPRFPFSSRDISMLCDSALTAGEISGVMRKTENNIVRKIQLLDVYEGEQIPEGKKSLAYSITYGLDDRTLTDEEIETAHSKIKHALEKKLGVIFR